MASAYETLEEGSLLVFPAVPWEFPEEDRAYLRGIPQTGSALHKNIAYRPASGKVTGFDQKAVPDPDRLRSVLKNFSDRSIAYLRAELPRYVENCRIDYASFRGVEEEGRDLAQKKRNDLLHIDAFPTRPTGGDLILRMFVNINPTQPRVWLTSDPFAAIARQHALAAGWARMSSQGPLARLLSRRSPYDRFMLHFHDYLKANHDYQQNCAKYRWEFPPGSAWMAFTDIVPHAVLSGQYALEQTVIVSRHALLSPARAPIEILKNLALTHAA